MSFRTAVTAATAATAVRSVLFGGTRNRVRAVLVTGALAAVPVAGLVTATGASAAAPSTWDAVASCESTGNWSANTGNGFSGGLQFTPSTWAAYGGTQYAASADQASSGQQIAVAEHVLASQGPGAWPVCGPKAGLTAGGPAATTDTSTPSTHTSSTSTPSTHTSGATASGATASGSTSSGGSARTYTSAPTHTAYTTRTHTAHAPAIGSSHGTDGSTGGSYTVRSGDTLGGIAAAHGTSWQALYSANQHTIGADADTIYPGQTLTLG